MKPLALVKPEADEHTVSMLENLLERAKAGEFQAFALFAIAQLPRSNAIYIGGGPNETDVIFAIERWKVQYLQRRADE